MSQIFLSGGSPCSVMMQGLFFNSNETEKTIKMSKIITKKQYLKSKKIVQQYETQLHAENNSEAFYVNEFNKIIDLDIFKIKIYGCKSSDTFQDETSNNTKHINLNENSVNVLRQFLNLKFPKWKN